MTIKNNYKYSEYMAKCVQSTNTDVIETRHILRQKLHMYTKFTHVDNAINRLDWV